MDERAKRLALVGVMLSIFLAAMESTVVATAMPRVVASLGGLDIYSWVFSGFLLTSTVTMPLWGRLSDLYGRRPVFLCGLVVFLVGSALSGLSQTMAQLIAFRMVQGIGAGLLVPVLTTLLVQAAGGRPLGKLMATVSLPAVLVPILGPVAGGLIVSNLSWRWIFYVNVPICLVALVPAWRGMSPSRGTAAAPRLDVAGLALLSPAVALTLYGLAQVSGDGGFAHRGVLIPLAADAMLLASFIAWALRPHRRVTPLVDLRLLRVRSFSAAAGLMFISGLSMYGALFLLPLYYQQIRGASALGAGLLLAPQGIGALLPRTLAGTLTDRIGPRPVVLAGMAIAAAGTVPFALAGAQRATA